MTIAPRTLLVPVPSSILSSYPIAAKGFTPRTKLSPLSTTAMGKAPAEVVQALVRLDQDVRAAGGDFRVTELLRAFAAQAEGRKRYETWVAAGKPKPGTAGFNAATMKAAFVAEVGFSGHNSGHSIDVHIGALRFPNVPADKQLDTLWAIAIALGWEPIIRQPDEAASESWHFDFWGEWGSARKRLSYSDTCMAMCLDAGLGADLYPRALEKAVQAQLQRIGFDIGALDGQIGPRSRQALAALGLPPTTGPEALYSFATNSAARS